MTFSSSSSSIKILLGITIYILTGILQPTLIDYLRINHLLGHHFLLLPTLANTLGMSLCGLLQNKSQWKMVWSHIQQQQQQQQQQQSSKISSSTHVRSIVWVWFRQLFTNHQSRSHHETINTTATTTTITTTTTTTTNRNLLVSILITSLVDLLSGMSLTFGLLLTGGGIFVILYNSCPVWTTLLSYFILRKVYTKLQILGVVSVCVGLIWNVWSSSSSSSHSEKWENDTNHQYYTQEQQQSTLQPEFQDNVSNLTIVVVEEEENRNMTIFIGSIIVLFGSLLHSLMFVLSDLVLRPSSSSACQHSHDNITTQSKKIDSDEIIINSSGSDNDDTTTTTGNISTSFTIPAEIWSSCLGTLEALFMLCWVGIGILLFGFNDDNNYKWNPDTATDEIEHNENAIFEFLQGFILLLLVDTLHAAAFFTLLKDIGAVGSALLKGVQTVAVVVSCAILFCHEEESQCFTKNKFGCVVFVLAGIMIYGWGSKISSSSTNSSSDTFANVKDHRQVLAFNARDKQQGAGTSIFEDRVSSSHPNMIEMESLIT